MSISNIGSASSSQGTSAATANTAQTLQQLAQEGDPAAIAELKLQEQLQQPAQPQTGAQEPGKGEQIDKYV